MHLLIFRSHFTRFPILTWSGWLAKEIGKDRYHCLAKDHSAVVLVIRYTFFSTKYPDRQTQTKAHTFIQAITRFSSGAVIEAVVVVIKQSRKQPSHPSHDKEPKRKKPTDGLARPFCVFTLVLRHNYSDNLLLVAKTGKKHFPPIFLSSPLSSLRNKPI